MKLRFITVAIALLYALLAVPGLVEHHHAADAHGADRDCAACVWQASSSVDVPIVTVAANRPVVVLRVAADSSVALPAFLPVATASRAPPETLA